MNNQLFEKIIISFYHLKVKLLKPISSKLVLIKFIFILIKSNFAIIFYTFKSYLDFIYEY